MFDKVNSVWDTPVPRQLAEVLTAIDDQTAMQNFLRDVMTEKEIIEVSARLEAARMLQAGKTYAEIIEKTKLSSRTVARIREWMENGAGGYNQVLTWAISHPKHIPPASAE